MAGKDFRSKLSSKNQLTLPSGISAFLHVGPGDSVRFEITENGVVVEPVPVRERLAPLIGRWRRKSGKTGEQIDDEVRTLRGERPK